MATYDFYCPTCDANEEVEQSIHASLDDVVCILGHPMKRIYRPAAVVFKGGGFYSTGG